MKTYFSLFVWIAVEVRSVLWDQFFFLDRLLSAMPVPPVGTLKDNAVDSLACPHTLITVCLLVGSFSFSIGHPNSQAQVALTIETVRFFANFYARCDGSALGSSLYSP